MLKSSAYIAAIAAGILCGASGASALVEPVTPEIIFGTGNANGGFTVNTFDTGVGPIEVGMRAKLRFDDTTGCNAFGFTGVGCPQNTFNYNAITDTYVFDPANGNPPPGYAMWNFEWSVDVESANADLYTLYLSDARAEIALDTDPTASTNFVVYDPFDSNAAVTAYYGTRETDNGEGTLKSIPEDGDTVAQQSVNYGFIPGFPTGAGEFDLEFRLFNTSGGEIGSTNIKVNVVPVPAALPMLAAVVGGLGWLCRRHRKAAQV